jgi:hypothetical protein
MPGEVAFELDTSRLNRALGDVLDALMGRGDLSDARELLRQEGKLFTRQAIRFTPPKSRQQGEQAIERELGSLFSEADQHTLDEIGSKHGLHHIDAYLALRGGGKGNVVHLQWENLDPTGERMQEYHNAYRNARGRVPLRKQRKGMWASRVVVPKGMKEPYIERVKKHVGRWKASWCKLAGVLGVNVPSWIAAHVSASNPRAIGDISGLHHGPVPTLVMGSRAPGVAGQDHAVRSALDVRAKSLARRAKLIVSGYSKDLAAGMRPGSRRLQEPRDTEIESE